MPRPLGLPFQLLPSIMLPGLIALIKAWSFLESVPRTRPLIVPRLAPGGTCPQDIT